MLGLQSVAYSYAAINFISSAEQYTYVPTAHNQSTPAESAAPVPLCLDRDRADSVPQTNLRPTATSIAAETDVVAARQALARDFYETNTDWDAARIDSHLSGIDFTKPVDIVNIPEGAQLSQWNFAGSRVGNYFTDVGTGPNGLPTTFRFLFLILLAECTV